MPDDQLANALGIRPLSETKEIITIDPSNITQVNESNVVEDNSAAIDFETARDATKQALDKGLVALDQMMEVARVSEHPRAYEVVATMLNTVTSIGDQLLKLQKQRLDLVPSDQREEKTVTNNIVVMSTTELLRQVRSAMNGDQ
jgi:hypothetical protein